MQGVQCDKDGSHMDCGKDVPVETRATCRPLYVSPNADAFCGPDGWTIPDFSCQISNNEIKESRILFYSSLEKEIGEIFLEKEFCEGILRNLKFDFNFQFVGKPKGILTTALLVPQSTKSLKEILTRGFVLVR